MSAKIDLALFFCDGLHIHIMRDANNTQVTKCSNISFTLLFKIIQDIDQLPFMTLFTAHLRLDLQDTFTKENSYYTRGPPTGQ